ncbi:uncharacterized protein LOC142615514 isoform X2 [Castanea sativa]|uniref:uncharacterized protein LOC142615514 isoform X2 n=1 Tax=Castanea sativa TaxID=21020 RepID=UPI003F64FE5C
MGLDIDPKLKSECEEALKDGDSLMNIGKLKEALPYYEKVMDKLTFKIAQFSWCAINLRVFNISNCYQLSNNIYLYAII